MRPYGKDIRRHKIHGSECGVCSPDDDSDDHRKAQRGSERLKQRQRTLELKKLANAGNVEYY